MRAAATGDLHLGYRAYSATEGGRNVRELDVEDAWRRTVDGMIEAEVELVTVAGDVFHHPRVGVHALRAWRDGVRRLAEAGIPVVAIPGNHDAGRTSDVLTPTVIPDDVHRVTVSTVPERVPVVTRSAEKVIVTCLPFAPMEPPESYKLEPDPDADVNVLLLHASVKSSALTGDDKLPWFYHGERALDVARHADRWDVIHAGDWHELTRLHPDRLAFYPGAIERTTSNPWQETGPFGWVLYDTDAVQMVHHTVDVRPFEVHTLAPPSAHELNIALRDEAEAEGPAGPDGKVIRWTVRGLPRGDRDRIDWKAVRTLKKRAVHFRIDLEFAEPEDARPLATGDDESGHSVDEAAADFMADDPEEVRATALEYLATA